MRLVLLMGLVIVGIATTGFYTVEGRNGEIASYQTETSIKGEALTVLRENCNTCHKRWNPQKFFTLENMDGFAPMIKEQVFVLKRMPKGKKNVLSEKEYEALNAWLLNLDGS